VQKIRKIRKIRKNAGQRTIVSNIRNNCSLTRILFDIGDVDISGFGLQFRRGGEFDDLIGIIGFADAVVFETAAVVPLPASVWLFGTALIGLVGFSKRRKAT
jgi:hypothetical protein